MFENFSSYIFHWIEPEEMLFVYISTVVIIALFICGVLYEKEQKEMKGEINK